jgi:hypothetical protein
MSKKRQYDRSGFGEAKSEHFTIAIRPSEKKVLDQLCRHFRKNRSELVRFLIEQKAKRVLRQAPTTESDAQPA